MDNIIVFVYTKRYIENRGRNLTLGHAQNVNVVTFRLEEKYCWSEKPALVNMFSHERKPR
jgi:hypothetical protein